MLRERIYQEENPSDWIRDACYQKLERERDPKIIDSQIEYHKEEIKKLQDLKKSKNIDKDKIKECLKYWHDTFENKTFLDDKELIREIEKRILPNLKKLGYEGSSKDIAELFLNWPEE